MLRDELIARAQRCAELQAMLDADPKAKAAGDWISEIAQKCLSRGEERHVAIVGQALTLRKKIAMTEAMPDDTEAFKDRRSRLRDRLDAMEARDPTRARFTAKLARLDEMIANGANVAKRARLPALRQKLARLSVSPALITKGDLIDG